MAAQKSKLSRTSALRPGTAATTRVWNTHKF
jgi:hypothetical protein